MKFRPAPIFEIVRLIDLQPPGETGFCMLVASSAATEFVSELREELDLQIAGSLGLIEVAELTAIALLDQLRTGGDAVVLMAGFDRWGDSQFVALDVNRSRLDTGAFLIFHVDLKTAGRFLDHAPNIRSFLGPNIFAPVPDTSSMGPREISDRLNQLRTHYGMSDAEVIDRAAKNDLPAEPDFIEWLVLLGRSELVL
ncbi:hypothetical protein SBA6_70006 [Candidatus Sulfopaludibacter sp. SbA6]|nr:hypothetical protein SBA6_70006 [Candidatus Sulfopaludibacter sp. SbA6]